MAVLAHPYLLSTMFIILYLLEVAKLRMSNPNLNRPLYTLCQYSGGIRTDHTSTSNPIYSTAGTLYELYSDSTARVQAMRQRLMTNTSSRFVPEFKLKPQAQTQLPCYATSPQIFFFSAENMRVRDT